MFTLVKWRTRREWRKGATNVDIRIEANTYSTITIGVHQFSEWSVLLDFELDDGIVLSKNFEVNMFRFSSFCILKSLQMKWLMVSGGLVIGNSFFFLWLHRVRWICGELQLIDRSGRHLLSIRRCDTGEMAKDRQTVYSIEMILRHNAKLPTIYFRLKWKFTASIFIARKFHADVWILRISKWVSFQRICGVLNAWTQTTDFRYNRKKHWSTAPYFIFC